jgi:hypothetical protein
VDDFYLTSNGLAVIETTIGNYNADLWSLLTTQSVLSWVRVNVANAMASNAVQWTELFSEENSGTYNNQWMVLDMNLFEPGLPLVNNTFMLLEQLPGFIAVEDRSAQLNDERYFGSYNIPAVDSVWALAGFGSQQPSWKYAYNECPRYNMMLNLNASVQSVDSYKQMIRFNEFGRDSNVQDAAAGYGISSRFDLFPTTSKQHSFFGGIDSKATSITMATDGLMFWAQNGPTHDTQPVFDWSSAGRYEDLPSHVGMPDEWNFDWILYTPLSN